MTKPLVLDPYLADLTTPIGRLLLGSDGEHLTHVWLPRNTVTTAVATKHPIPVLLRAQEELSEYFARERSVFTLPLYYEGTTFQHAVWRTLAELPLGATTTYLQLATAAGYPKSARPVGHAVNQNPLAIVIPCHRVLGTRDLGGYAGGLEMKRELLELEGALAPRKALSLV